MDIAQFVVREEDADQAQFPDLPTGIFKLQTSPEKKAISINVQFQRLSLEQRARGFNRCSGNEDAASTGPGLSYHSY